LFFAISLPVRFFSLVACCSSFSSSTRVYVLHELEGEVR